MELQRNAMLMYTSCGWFFDELSGIETVQVIQYAGRVLQLADELFSEAFEPGFLELLEHARSNIPEHRDGRTVYEKWVRPAMLDIKDVGAHYALSSLFQDVGERSSIYAYSATRDDYRSFQVGGSRLVVGRATVISEVTRATSSLCFGVLHLGDQASPAALVNTRARKNMKRWPKRFQRLSPEPISRRPYFFWVNTSGRPPTL